MSRPVAGGDPDTLPKLLRHNAATHGDAVAMREKDYGIWNEISWRDVDRHVGWIALGLESLGLAAAEVVAILGDNRPAWVWAEIAAQVCGAVSLGIYRDTLADEVAYLAGFPEARIVFAEDEEQVDKLLELGDRLPRLEHIVYDDPRGLRKLDDPRLIALTDLEARGRERDAARPGHYAGLVAATRADAVAVLCTTSGTTARPKLAMIEHRSLIGHCRAYLEVDPVDATDEYVSVLPLPWIAEQVYAVGWWLLARMKVNFVEETVTAMSDLREIGPTFLFLAPRVWEQIAADVRARIMDASPLKRSLYAFAMGRAVSALDRGRTSWLAEVLLCRPLRDRLGFSRLVSAETGGAALGPETFKFFLALGVPLRQLYGQTELLGPYTLHRRDDVDFDTAGVPFRGVEVEIRDPDGDGVGQIVARHPHRMRGYFRDPAASRETLTDDGWMLSGDAGFFNRAGHLVVIDRLSDLAETAGGHRFSPQYIENKLKFSPYIAEAVVLGAGRDYLAAIVCIRWSIVSKWAEKQRIAFTTYTDLAARAEVRRRIRAEVEEVNAGLPEHQKIRKFLLLYKELDADDGELTRTRKVRRAVVAEKYAGVIDALYSRRDRVEVDTTIAFQDGTRQRIRTTLAVVDLQRGGE